MGASSFFQIAVEAKSSRPWGAPGPMAAPASDNYLRTQVHNT
jgi:hypothetical protein